MSTAAEHPRFLRCSIVNLQYCFDGYEERRDSPREPNWDPRFRSQFRPQVLGFTFRVPVARIEL